MFSMALHRMFTLGLAIADVVHTWFVYGFTWFVYGCGVFLDYDVSLHLFCFGLSMDGYTTKTE